jgi:uncharacterized protein YabN with tetrapyrrole methylase and pyrophosphatase domain
MFYFRWSIMLVFLMLIQRTPLNVQIKFIKRFQYLESKGRFRKTLNGYDFAEMDIFWEEAKKL